MPGRPLAGLVLLAFDADFFFDDALGSATTDASGYFEIRFTRSSFQDIIESRPDVYFRVYEADGKTLLLETKDQVRRDIRSEAHFDLQIRRATG